MKRIKVLTRLFDKYKPNEPLKTWSKSDLLRFYSLLLSSDFEIFLKYFSEFIDHKSYLEFSKSGKVDIDEFQEIKVLFQFRAEIEKLPKRILAVTENSERKLKSLE